MEKLAPDWLLRDVIEELEYIRDTWTDRSIEENWEAVHEQAKRLILKTKEELN